MRNFGKLILLGIYMLANRLKNKETECISYVPVVLLLVKFQMLIAKIPSLSNHLETPFEHLQSLIS